MRYTAFYNNYFFKHWWLKRKSTLLLRIEIMLFKFDSAHQKKMPALAIPKESGIKNGPPSDRIEN